MNLPPVKLPPPLFGYTAARQIVKAVALSHGLTVEQILRSGRCTDHVAHPRQLAMCLVRLRTELSLQSVSTFFGKSDHGTIVYAVKSMRKRCAADATFKAAFDQWLAFDYSTIIPD